MPAPKPLVIFLPTWIFSGILVLCSAWASVLTAIKSTPFTLAAIILPTAFPPPPPTPITLILANDSTCGFISGINLYYLLSFTATNNVTVG